jgi:predicted Rossmann fold flavoprotein
MTELSSPEGPLAEPGATVVVGAGAAGLMAAIWAARTRPGRVVVALDGARRLGAKILVSGGGRCNVTHERVDERDFNGASPNAIRKVLRRFGVADVIAFFKEQGVTLKREETGKLFPTTDDSRTILNALLGAARRAGVRIKHPRPVARVSRAEQGFLVKGDWGEVRASAVVLATGGVSLPRSGSGGDRYELARSLGHSITPWILPALVPLTLPDGHFMRRLSGLTVKARVEVHGSTGRRLASATGSMLCAHFGLSGPAVLDISRHYLLAKLNDPRARLVINWLPDWTAERLDADLRGLEQTRPVSFFRRLLPDRLVEALFRDAGVAVDTAGHSLTRADRLALVRVFTRMEAPVSGHRGFSVAEATAGGVPLSELRLERMESKICPGLFMCGEMCDVDGRIGGFNFQWAWASGYVAGISV